MHTHSRSHTLFCPQSNGLALHWLGPNVESACGRGRFALIYLSAVVSGSWLQYSMSAYNTVAWGASGKRGWADLSELR